MALGLLHQDGERLRPRPMTASPAAWRQAVTPDRDALVIPVECVCPWSWLADRCAREGLPFVLGQARSLPAIHGGQATHAPLAAPKRAVRRRGGMLPPASGDPATRRATRALLRRRMPLVRPRAALRAHVQKPHRPSPLAARSKPLASQAHREGLAARGAAPAGQQTSALACAWMARDDQLLNAGA
jgi:hypothetical protein